MASAEISSPDYGLEVVDNVTTFSTASPDIGWYDNDNHHPYTLLKPNEVTRRLLASSQPESGVLGDGIRVDSVEWQPNPTELEVRALLAAGGPSQRAHLTDLSPNDRCSSFCSQRRTGRSCATFLGEVARARCSVSLTVRPLRTTPLQSPAHLSADERRLSQATSASISSST